MWGRTYGRPPTEGYADRTQRHAAGRSGDWGGVRQTTVTTAAAQATVTFRIAEVALAVNRPVCVSEWTNLTSVVAPGLKV
jgi:hypothetical protein